MSKFSVVLKLRKRQLDKAEMSLNQARLKKAEFENKLEAVKAELKTLEMPINGRINELKFSLNLRFVAKDEIERLREKISLCEKEINHFQFLYQKANLDYEKIKALQSDELKKLATQAAKAEQKFIDEIAITRFFKNKN